mgnify:CR=1 FL=1
MFVVEQEGGVIKTLPAGLLNAAQAKAMATHGANIYMVKEVL